MDEFTKNLIIFVASPLILSIIGYFMKTHVDRIQVLEKEIDHKVNEREVRALMNDKLEPIREDIKELKATTDKILDILLKKANQK